MHVSASRVVFSHLVFWSEAAHFRLHIMNVKNRHADRQTGLFLSPLFSKVFFLLGHSMNCVCVCLREREAEKYLCVVSLFDFECKKLIKVWLVHAYL